jgi:elongation factor 1-alpha
MDTINAHTLTPSTKAIKTIKDAKDTENEPDENASELNYTESNIIVVNSVPISNNNIETSDNTMVTDKAFVVVGNVDAGKSTLIGTLTSGLLDDGRGSARKTVARHQHEIDSGKTSDISTRALKFPNGKTATLIDLCGHEKYFTTTATGIAGMWPDYAIVVISPTRGVLSMTKQHFKMLMSYNIPILIVVTRIDMALEESCKIVNKDISDLCKTYKRTVEFINSYSKYHAYMRGKKWTNDRDEIGYVMPRELNDDIVMQVNEYENFETQKLTAMNEINQGLKMGCGKQSYIPVVYVSNVDGYYLDVVKQAMCTVEPRDLWSKDENASSIVKYFRNTLKLPTLGLVDEHIGSTFYIDNTYIVKGVGLVVTGINRGDLIKIEEDMYIGPIAKSFIKVKLRSMHNNNREQVDHLSNHHRGCIAIKPFKDILKKNQICRGMVLISRTEMIRNVCFRFEAAVTIFGGHSATLRTGYSPIIHAGTIRQAAKLILPNELMSDEELAIVSTLSKRERKDKAQRKIRSGDVEKVMFKFRMRPEYLDSGTVFVFRSGDIHGVGCVINVVPLDHDSDAQPEPLKRKFRKIRPSDIGKQVRENKKNMNPPHVIGVSE